jgi:predicted ATP-dependent serine protease
MEARFPSPITCPVMIGRVKELATLRLLVDRVHSGEAQVVLVSGEAGIGKSRLVAEANASAAAHGFLLLEGQLSDQVQIFLRESVIAGNLSIGQISRDLGQRVALFWGQVGWGS